MALNVCLIAAEVAPLSKTGGLADVSGALAKYLHGAGHDARLFTPLYASIDRSKLTLRAVEFLQDVPLELGPHRYRYSVLAGHLPGSTATVYLIDCPVLYSRASIYTTDVDEHLRFLVLTRAALECCQRMNWSPAIVHCNDWHTAFGPLFLKSVYDWDQLFAGARSVLTIHNIGYQGVFSASAAGDVGLGAKGYLLHQDDLRAGFVNALKHGILYADAITTVSPTHALEICTDEYGMGLQSDLRARATSLTGILNGVDYEEWDPRNDRYLSRHFDARHLEEKAALKSEFAARLGLQLGPETPLLGIVSRMAMQKGFDLLFQSLPEVLAWRDLACVVLGNGEEKYESFFAQLQKDFPGRVHFHRGYSDELAHWIEGASDMFLMPSLYEPCGLNQMYSLRYGTVPIVRKTGGLADSVFPYDPATGQGTGVVFGPFESEALEFALNAALDLYTQPAHWARVTRNGMAQDFSWERQGALYVDLYERLLKA
ncbi:MAG TPA: glycogen synthase [Steroidobacteraceae bacterium]|jgi:starch synthase|nr:glycogen synthase [Steroidobacteraceae bacterium]